jgi:hypothetical protein
MVPVTSTTSRTDTLPSKVLERGDIYFAFRPRVDETRPESLEQVQRLFLILSPRDEDVYRRLVIGRKRLPEGAARERVWAFVDKVERRPEAVMDDLAASRYETKTMGERSQPAARLAGEGVYAIVDHRGHAHLAYELELPQQIGEVQDAFRIEPRTSYVASVWAPKRRRRPRAGLGSEERPRYPPELMKRFDGRRFTPLEPEFLNYVGAELILVGTDEDPERELGIRLEAEAETADTAEIFSDLKVDREKHPTRPLFAGAWE